MTGACRKHVRKKKKEHIPIIWGNRLWRLVRIKKGKYFDTHLSLRQMRIENIRKKKRKRKQVYTSII
jgi:hypothetical protein